MLHNLEVDGLGQGFENSIFDPERVLPKYDIVFAKAKAAMEAMATGAAVIICDFRGLGGMVSSQNFQHFRRLNFGMKSMTKEITLDAISAELKKYNHEESQIVNGSN